MILLRIQFYFKLKKLVPGYDSPLSCHGAALNSQTALFPLTLQVLPSILENHGMWPLVLFAFNPFIQVTLGDGAKMTRW